MVYVLDVYIEHVYVFHMLGGCAKHMILCPQVLFFGFGWLFFMRRLFKDYEVLCIFRSVVLTLGFQFL